MLNLLENNIIMNYMYTYTKELGYLTRKKKDQNMNKFIFLFHEAYGMHDCATLLKLKVPLTWLSH